MKKLPLLALSLFLAGCASTTAPATTDEMPAAPAPGENTVMEKNDDDMMMPDEAMLKLGNGLVLNDFSERDLINSPLELSGTAPRSWFFEGIFPINLMTLEGEVVTEGFGSGAWLEPLPGNTALNDNDAIPFTATLEFTAPVDGDMGKLSFSQDTTGLEETGAEAMVAETMILWP